MKLTFSIGNNFTFLKVFIAISSFAFLTGCGQVKIAGVKSGKKFFETFYVGEEGTQYFIKPLLFVNAQNEEELQMDFTFRYKDEVKDSVIVNLSLLSSTIFKSIDSLSLSNSSHTVGSKKVNLLFNERKKKLFHSRFSTKISLLQLQEIIEKDDWKIMVYSGETPLTYAPNKKTRKVLNKLKEAIFTLF